VTVKVHHPGPGTQEQAPKPASQPFAPPAYEKGTTYATAQAYGDALKALGASLPELVVVDAEVSNSTYAEIFKKAYPDRFFEIFIAEQQMVSAAQGLGRSARLPSPRPSPPSSRAPLTRSAWPPSAALTCACAAATPG
jgi:transketolase